MSRLSKILLLLLSVLLLTQCEQNNWGDYYDRPEWLGPPLYQTLVNAGNFTQYLSCVDRTGYAIDRSGSYTLFVPNDAAFNAYLQGRGMTSATELSDDEAKNIVAYSLVINPFSIDQLTTFQDATYGEDGVAFKRTTMMYDGMMFKRIFTHTDNGLEYTEPFDENGTPVVAYYNQNKHTTSSTPSLSNGFDRDDKGYKYIPYFVKGLKNFTAADYDAIYGAGRYAGGNVAQAQIVTEEPVAAENGLIYELDRVIEPLPTLDDILAQDTTVVAPDPAGFGKYRNLIETYSSAESPTTLVEFISESQLTASAQNAYPGLRVYVKLYSGSLAFAPNVEAYTTTYGKKDAQRYGYTLLAPNNAAVDKFNAYLTQRAGITLDNDTLMLLNNTLTVDLTSIKLSFINAHMSTEFFWPTQFAGHANQLGDFVAGSATAERDAAKVVDIRLASNGILYGHNDYIRSAYFESVYSELYMNPKYYMHKRAIMSYGADIRDDALLCLIKDKSASNHITLFLMPNELLTKDGFTYDVNNSPAFSNTNMTASNAATRINRLVNSHAVLRGQFEALASDFAGQAATEEGATYDQWSGYRVAQTYCGDLIRYKNGKVQGIGNMDGHTFVTPTLVYDPRVNSSDAANTTAYNGLAYEVDYLIEYSPREKVNNASGVYTASLDTDGSAWVDHEKVPMFRRIETDVEPDFDGMENPDTLWYNPDVNYMSQWLNHKLINQYNRVFVDNNNRTMTVLLPTDKTIKQKAIPQHYLEFPVTDIDLTWEPSFTPWLDTVNWYTAEFGGVFPTYEDSVYWINQIRYFVSHHVIIGNEFYEDDSTPVVSNYISLPTEYRTSSSLEVRGERPAVRVRKDANNKLYYYTEFNKIEGTQSQIVSSTVYADRSKGRNSYNMMASKMVFHVLSETEGNGFLVYDKPNR